MKRVALDSTVARARGLRLAATDAERKLWAALRGGQVGGCKFRRQQRLGSYIADFACLEARLVVEADGSQHADQAEYDNRRTAFLESEGYSVLRFTNLDILTNLNGVLEAITAAIPSPLRGEGGARVRSAWEGEGDSAACGRPPATSPVSRSPSPPQPAAGPLPLPSRERGL